MFLFKFNLFIFFFYSSFAFGFSDGACLSGNFTTKISHKVGTFSLLKNEIKISKELCNINIYFKKWNLFEKRWLIDYCRTPIHIKYGTGSFDVYKREDGCEKIDNKKERTQFCKQEEELENIISDEGLIFAPGLKEDISSDHGKVYCSYLILKSYLIDGVVYESNSQKFGGGKAEVVSTSTEATF